MESGNRALFGILECERETQQSDVYMNGRHRNAEMGATRNQTYTVMATGSGLITYEFECGNKSSGNLRSHVEVTVVGAVARDLAEFVSKSHKCYGHNRFIRT